MRVVLLRHGESEANVNKQFAGFLDTPLTERGRAQAEQAALYMGWYEFDRVLSSPLERAFETAQIATSINSVGSSCLPHESIEKYDTLKEMNFGKCEGLTYQEILSQMPELIKQTNADYAHALYPEGESLYTFYHRVVEGYELLKQSFLQEEGNILLVSHSGVVRTILAHELGGGFEGYWHYKIENCGFAVLEYDQDYPILTEINNMIGKE